MAAILRVVVSLISFSVWYLCTKRLLDFLYNFVAYCFVKNVYQHFLGKTWGMLSYNLQVKILWFFPFQYASIQSPSLLVLHKTSSIILNKYVESEQFCFVPDFSGSALASSSFKLMLAMSLLWTDFVMLKYAPYILNLCSTLSWSGTFSREPFL